MKHLFAKWLSALLVAALLMSPAALMEEAPLAESDEAVSAAVDAPVEEASAELDEADDPVYAEIELDLGDEDAPLFAGGAEYTIADTAVFPDANFQAYLSTEVDTNSDGKLSQAEIDVVKNLWPSDRNIQSLKGIELFTSLKSLTCDGNPLDSQDVSANVELKMLHCNVCGLAKLDVSKNPKLYNLYCNANALTELDLSSNAALEELHCDNNKLASLNIKNLPLLHDVSCVHNELTELDIRGCDALLPYIDDQYYTEDDYDADTRFCGYYWENSQDWSIWVEIFFDPAVKEHLIIKDPDPTPVDPTPAQTVEPAPTLAPIVTAPVTPTIAAVKKSTKATVTAAPGTVYQLDLGGATGKQFKSSKKKVATVKNGVVTFKKPGKVTITATAKRGKKKAKIKLTVVK